MNNPILTLPARSVARVTLAMATLFALAACSGDPRPLQEPVEVEELGITGLQIESDQATLDETVINPGQSIQYTFKAFDSNGNDITANVPTDERRWSVSNYDVADISGTGLLMSRTDGVITVGLRIGSVSAVPRSVRVSSAQLAVIDGITGQDVITQCSVSDPYTATGTFTDGTVRVLDNLEWSIANNPSGVLLSSDVKEAVVGGLQTGSFTLMATSGGITGDKPITVQAGVESLAITPTSPIEVQRSANRELFARASYTDTNMQSQDVSRLATWEVEEGSNVASITVADNGQVFLRGLVLGQTRVTATCTAAAVASADIEVVEPSNFVGLRIEPTNDPIELFVSGGTEQLRVFALTSLGSDEEVTDRATWQVQSGGETIVSVDNTSSNGGLLTPLAVGRATIEVSFGGIEQTVGVIVQ